MSRGEVEKEHRAHLQKDDGEEGYSVVVDDLENNLSCEYEEVEDDQHPLAQAGYEVDGGGSRQ